MASLRKVPGCKNWIACFTDRDGRRKQRSTGEVDRKKAQRIADGYEAVARGKKTIRQVRGVLSDLSELVTGESLKVVSFEDFVKGWLERKTHEVSGATLDYYRKSVQTFRDFLGPKARKEICEITESDIVAFRNNRMSAGFAGKTVNNTLKALRVIFKAAKAEGLIADDPAEYVKAVKDTRQSDRRAFSKDEIKAILCHCDPEWRSMVLFGIYTGQRLSDLALLTWGNLDLSNRELRLAAAKTGKRIIIPLAGALLAHIETLKPGNPSDPIHPECFKIRRENVKAGALSNAFGKILAKAGLREKVAKAKLKDGQGRSAPRKSRGLSFHSLRHTAVTMLKEAGIPAAVVMELVGHDSKAISEHYTHVGSEALKKAAEAFPVL